jgi:hypothetical protein
MTTMPGGPPELPYEMVAPNAYQWTEVAYDMLEDGRLTASITATGGIQTARVDGPCPRCEHPLNVQQILDIVTGEDMATLGSHVATVNVDEYVPLIVPCECTEGHDGRPEGVTHGCGINFRLDVRPE